MGRVVLTFFFPADLGSVRIGIKAKSGLFKIVSFGGSTFGREGPVVGRWGGGGHGFGVSR